MRQESRDGLGFARFSAAIVLLGSALIATSGRAHAQGGPGGTTSQSLEIGAGNIYQMNDFQAVPGGGTEKYKLGFQIGSESDGFPVTIQLEAKASATDPSYVVHAGFGQKIYGTVYLPDASAPTKIFYSGKFTTRAISGNTNTPGTYLVTGQLMIVPSTTPGQPPAITWKGTGIGHLAKDWLAQKAGDTAATDTLSATAYNDPCSGDPDDLSLSLAP